MDIGQSVITTGVAIGEPFVIEAEQVEHGGMQIVDMDRVVFSTETEVVG